MNRNFGENLKREMWKAEITGKQLAKEINVSPVTISRYRTGKRYPNVLILKHIKNALGCDIAELV
jgi:transcriptional regulator with XRE-family HTH domain